MRFVSIFGPPGAGKTTAAVPLAKVLDAAYISSGDIARRVDPGAIAVGKMADRALLREGFVDAILDAARDGRKTCVIDGLPRDPTDCELLPDEAIYLLLIAKPTILAKRQLERGRPGDERAIIDNRTTEQMKLMQLHLNDGWAYRIAGRNVVDTSKLTVVGQLEAVYSKLRGEGVAID